MKDESITLVVSVIAVFLTFLTVCVTYYATKRQNQLSATAVTSEWLRDLRIWAREVIAVMAEAQYFLSEEGVKKKAEVTFYRAKISALIDQGKLLLPNLNTREYGQNKADASKGYRHSALDPLVVVEKLLAGKMDLQAFPDLSTALKSVRKEFVSITQQILNPKSMNNTVASLVRDNKLGRIDLLDKQTPPGADALLELLSRRYELSEAMSEYKKTPS